MPVQCRRQENTALLILDRGVTHAIAHQTITDLLSLLEDTAADGTVRGLVLGSANDKFLSIGFDIPRLLQLSTEEMGCFYHDFNSLCLRLYTFPKPTVAAVDGVSLAANSVNIAWPMRK